MAVVEYRSADLQGKDGLHLFTEVGMLADERKHIFLTAVTSSNNTIYLGVADDIPTAPRLDDLTLMRLTREDATALAKWLINALL